MPFLRVMTPKTPSENKTEEINKKEEVHNQKTIPTRKLQDLENKPLHAQKNESYEEIDTRLASGWYVDTSNSNNKKKYKTKEVVFKISKKS